MSHKLIWIIKYLYHYPSVLYTFILFHKHTHRYTAIYIYIYIYVNTCVWVWSWYNGEHQRKWGRWTEFKSFIKLFAFPIRLISLGKVWIQLRGVFNKFLDVFLYRHLKLSLTLENSVCYYYTFSEMTDQSLWFQVQRKGYSRNWNTPYCDCHSW